MHRVGHQGEFAEHVKERHDMALVGIIDVAGFRWVEM
jgi:hypothetical protein